MSQFNTEGADITGCCQVTDSCDLIGRALTSHKAISEAGITPEVSLLPPA